MLACFVSMTLFSAAGGVAAAVSGLVLVRWALVLMHPMIGASLGLYPAVGMSPLAEMRLTTITTTLWIAILDLICVVHATNPARMVLALSLTWLIALVLVPVFRSMARSLAARMWWWSQPAVVFGSGAEAAAVYRRLQANPARGLRPIGVVSDLGSHWADDSLDTAWYLGPSAATRNIADRFNVFWGIIVLAKNSTAELTEILDRHATTIPHFLVVNALDEDGLRGWDGARDCGGLAGTRIDERLLLPGPKFIKRAMDVAVAALGGLFLLPLLAAIACFVKLTSEGPVFFSQQRVGHNGRRFRAWKFRSMVANADALLPKYLEKHPEQRLEWERYRKLKRDPRLTRVGRLLRKTSLDELPQLWNVLRGDMSLVGPRPITPDEIDRYPHLHLYTRLRPGITGLWQINGRNLTSFQSRAEFDAHYIRNWSPWFDAYILARTLKVVLRCEGAY